MKDREAEARQEIERLSVQAAAVGRDRDALLATLATTEKRLEGKLAEEHWA